MKKTRILSVVLSVALILTSFSMTAFALNFDDVENDPTVSWAKESITKMTDAGYIKGYEDGTFRPYKEITRIECLILMSRMLGYEKIKNTDTAENATAVYGDIVSKYNKTYVGELCYLLYLGVLKEGDLADYSSAVNANTPLFRYQAAALMSKLMVADAEAKSYNVSNATYADNSSIPASYRGYVEFVTAEKIMNGMDADENGNPMFSPLSSLTRAQMATLLARMMGVIDYEVKEGVVEDAYDSTVVVDGKNYKLNDSGKAYINGTESAVADINVGDSVKITIVCGDALIIEAKEAEVLATVYGVVLRKSENSSGKKITIADYEDESISETYTLLSDCKIKVDGTTAMFGDIMADDFVKLELVGSKVKEISTADTRMDITGILDSVEHDAENHVYLNVADKNGENVQTYTASIKGVKIARDGENAEFRDLSAGDTVELRLVYGKVSIVTATSKSETLSGLLTEIIISNSPSLTISVDGVPKNYKLRSDAKIMIAGVEKEIYDLRPNITVTAKLDSSEIKSVSAATITTNEKGEMVGTVVGKNTSYSVITIEDENGNTQSVYYNAKTTFLNSNGQAATAKSIEKGATISVTGADKNGVFEATIIIIK